MLEVTITAYSTEVISLRVTFIGRCITYQYYSSAQQNLLAYFNDILPHG